MRKYAVLAVFLALLVSVGVALAGGGAGSKSDPITISVGNDPLTVSLAHANRSTNADEVGNLEYWLYPGEPIFLAYEISNAAQVGYVVEVIPTITGNFQKAPVWGIQQLQGTTGLPSFEENIQGPAHLFVGGGGKTHVALLLKFPLDVGVGTTVSVVLNVNRTDCPQVENCPWG